MGTWRVEEGSLDNLEKGGALARRRLFPKCKNLTLKPGREAESCRGLECDWNYRCIERDARGPVRVQITVMDITSTWRRVSIQDTTSFEFEKEEQDGLASGVLQYPDD
jgi:hypothetical protein